MFAIVNSSNFLRGAFIRGPNGALIVNHERASRTEKNQRHSAHINIFPDVQTGPSQVRAQRAEPHRVERHYWTLVNSFCSAALPSSSSGSSGRRGSPTAAPINSNPALTVVAGPAATMNPTRGLSSV